MNKSKLDEMLSSTQTNRRHAAQGVLLNLLVVRTGRLHAAQAEILTLRRVLTAWKNRCDEIDAGYPADVDLVLGRTAAHYKDLTTISTAELAQLRRAAGLHAEDYFLAHPERHTPQGKPLNPTP